MLQAKLIKRGVPVKNLDIGDIKPATGDSVTREIKLKTALDSETAKKVERLGSTVRAQPSGSTSPTEVGPVGPALAFLNPSVMPVSVGPPDTADPPVMADKPENATQEESYDIVVWVANLASDAIVVAPARPKAETMSTRCPAQVKRTAVTASEGNGPRPRDAARGGARLDVPGRDVGDGLGLVNGENLPA